MVSKIHVLVKIYRKANIGDNSVIVKNVILELRRGINVGVNPVILPSIEECFITAGAVVTKNALPWSLVGLHAKIFNLPMVLNKLKT